MVSMSLQMMIAVKLLVAVGVVHLGRVEQRHHHHPVAQCDQQSAKVGIIGCSFGCATLQIVSLTFGTLCVVVETPLGSDQLSFCVVRYAMPLLALVFASVPQEVMRMRVATPASWMCWRLYRHCMRLCGMSFRMPQSCLALACRQALC